MLRPILMWLRVGIRIGAIAWEMFALAFPAFWLTHWIARLRRRQ